MRRNNRGIYEDTDNYKVILLVAGGILLLAIISFFVVYGIYNDKIDSSELATINKENSKIDVSNTLKNSTVVSSSIGKNVNEVKNSVNENVLQNDVSNSVGISINAIETSDNKVSNNENAANVSEVTTSNTQSITDMEESKETLQKEEKEPSFKNPIEDGELMREFAKDSLVYSDTLEEWITHLGIDIKAPKTTVVKAAEAGEVESIKNDPRYGLTIIIKHAKDYKTVYSNLLTTEFVNVGDKIEVGQSIGTVGNSAAFEIADEPHLHFEIIKSGEKVDPSLYIK